MTKSDLRTGMIVQMRDGEFFIVMLDVKVNNLENAKDILLHIDNGEILYDSFDYLNEYYEDLTPCFGDAHEVIIDNVYIPQKDSMVGRIDHYRKVWSRGVSTYNESDAKDMTLDEIEKELGHKVRIVS